MLAQSCRGFRWLRARPAASDSGGGNDGKVNCQGRRTRRSMVATAQLDSLVSMFANDTLRRPICRKAWYYLPRLREVLNWPKFIGQYPCVCATGIWPCCRRGRQISPDVDCLVLRMAENLVYVVNAVSAKMNCCSGGLFMELDTFMIFISGFYRF